MTVQLQAGDSLILLSDGFDERMNPADDVWGDEAVTVTLCAICRTERRADDIAQKLFAACDAFADGRGNA